MLERRKQCQVLYICICIQNIVCWMALAVSIRLMDTVVKEIGQTAVAITDHGVMYGVIDFYQVLRKKHGIKPIIGCEVYVAPAYSF